MKIKEIIKLEKLSKFYGKERGIIDINLTVNRGEIFGFIGPNGAGKSTTIRTILGLLIPTGGKASIFGLDTVRDSTRIKQNIGFIPSEVNYYDTMSVLELLNYSAGFYNKNCTKQIDRLKNIFEVDLHKDISNLSMGNKKKVAILQCLIHEPDLLILDEPTTGLDPMMQAEFYKILKEVNSLGVTIFFSSHILNEVQHLCDRVAIIKEGRIIRVETIQELRNRFMKKIHLTLPSSSDPGKLNLKNITSPRIINNQIHFYYTAGINQLLNELKKTDIVDINITQPNLEEIFMHYYEKNNGEKNEI